MTAQTLIGMLHRKVTLKMDVNVKDRKREERVSNEEQQHWPWIGYLCTSFMCEI